MFFPEPVMSLVSPVMSLVLRRTTNCLSLAFYFTLQAPYLFSEEFQALTDQKPLFTENYTILHERNVTMRWITTLVTL